MFDFKDKVRFVKENVSMEKLLIHYGISLRKDQLKLYKTSQISCPIHGKDTHKSAKYFENSNSFYCWTCARQYFNIDLVMNKEGKNFNDAVYYLLNLSDKPYIPKPIEIVTDDDYIARLNLLEKKVRWLFEKGYPLQDSIKMFEMIDNLILSKDVVNLNKLGVFVNGVNI